MRNVLIKQAYNYGYSSYDAFVLPNLLRKITIYCEISWAPCELTQLWTQFQGQAQEEKERWGRYSTQMPYYHQIEIEPKHYNNGSQNDNINSFAYM